MYIFLWLWVNEKPSCTYADSGCGATKGTADNNEWGLIAERTKITVSVYGRTTIPIKIECTEGRVKTMIVSNHAQMIPILVAHSFIKQPGYLMNVSS